VCPKRTTVVRTEVIAHRIIVIRGRKVMLDSDLAELYGMATKSGPQKHGAFPSRFHVSAVLENKCDRQFKVVFDAIRHLMAEPARSRRRIGFTSD